MPTLNNEVSILNIANVDNDLKDKFTRTMIAGEEVNSYATRNYDVNEYFIWDDRRLYKTLTAITTGTAFELNINVRYIGDIASQLYELFAQSPENIRELISYIEESANATKTYSTGDMFLWTDGFLYKATTDITLGTALVVDTNIALAGKIADIIKALSDKTYNVDDAANETINDTDYIPVSTSLGVKKKSLWSTIIAKIKTAIGKSDVGLANVANIDQSKAVKSISRSGTTFTATCLDGSTFTFTQQDNNTTYSNVSKSAAGLCPQLPNETTTAKYLRQDGSWQVPPDNNTTYSAGTGLSLSSNAFSVKYGTAAGTACQGNDSRLSNSRTPTSHASTGTGYGVGNASNYGHVKLSDTYNSNVGAAANSIGASQTALYNVYNSFANHIAYHVFSVSQFSVNAQNSADIIINIATQLNAGWQFFAVSTYNLNWRSLHLAAFWVDTNAKQFKASIYNTSNSNASNLDLSFALLFIKTPLYTGV